MNEYEAHQRKWNSKVFTGLLFQHRNTPSKKKMCGQYEKACVMKDMIIMYLLALFLFGFRDS